MVLAYIRNADGAEAAVEMFRLVQLPCCESAPVVGDLEQGFVPIDVVLWTIK